MKTKTSLGYIAEIWDAKVGENNNVVSAQVTSNSVTALLGNPKGKRIYEIDCGNGFLTRHFAKHGLLISTILEPPSTTKATGKLQESLIPSFWIIKAVKIL